MKMPFNQYILKAEQIRERKTYQKYVMNKRGNLNDFETQMIYPRLHII